MRLVRRIFVGVLVLVLAFAGLVVTLALRTADPRASRGWQRLADMPDPRGEVASVVRDGKLYVAGGIAGLGRTVARTDVFDAAANRWSRGPELPEPRHHAAATVVRRTIFLTGGSKRATKWTPERNVWALSQGSQKWVELPPMPEARMAHQMVAVGGKLYVVGGRGKTSRVIVYDPASGWSLGASMPHKRDHLAAAWMQTPEGPAIFAMGGRDDDVRPFVDVYLVNKDRWKAGPALPIPMSAMAAGRLGEVIHVVGGEDPKTLGGGVLDAHYGLAASGSAWVVGRLPILAVHGAAFGVIGDRLIIAGGARRQGTLSVLGWTGITQAYSTRP